MFPYYSPAQQNYVSPYCGNAFVGRMYGLIMEQRKTVDEKISFTIKEAKEYKTEITFGELCAVKDVLPSDILNDISFKKEKGSGFGLMSEDDIRSYYVPTLTVVRKRPETDDEFLKRKQEEESVNRQKDEKERLEYLRLKAKFERS